MEKVVCSIHGGVCMLKTGLKDGPNKGKSFYVCVDKQGCDFSQQTSISPSHCLHHEDSMVELQALNYSQQQQGYRLFYRCAVGKKAGQRWCGNVPWTAVSAVTDFPTHTCFFIYIQYLYHQRFLPSCLPPVRNPFKAPSQTDKDSGWRKLHNNRHEEREASHKAEGRANYQKENERQQGAGVEEKADDKHRSSDTYRGKQLPPGMKLKKRVSDEENNSPKENSVEKRTEKIQDTPEQNRIKQGEAEKGISSSNVKTVHSESSNKHQLKTINQTAPVSHRNLTQQPSDAETSQVKETKQILENSSCTHASRDSDSSRSPIPDNPTQPESSQPNSPENDDDDDVVLVSVKPAPQKTPPVSTVQKTLTNFPGFQPASNIKKPVENPKGLQNLLTVQLQQKKATLSSVNLEALPDKGERLRTQVKELEEALESLSLTAASQPGRTYPQAQTFYGGRMTNDRLLAVKNATCEAIDHLHKSLESCPDAEAEAPDPKGIKVPLLPHQRRALAWLLWRETQSPCGGILADDMGLGKTLTMISLILAMKMKAKKDKEEMEEKKKDSCYFLGTLIICPASLVHHWKKEIDRHVKTGKLTVYLYHGPNRERSARALADYDVVVTTYSLVSKEIPVQKEEADKPNTDKDDVRPGSAPLLRVSWARIILDEAHSIKNPKVQTSMAVCQLRAGARWAVTGTPIQNNLLDMYSLLKFLRCSPFDEYKLWKAQVDNGSKRGRERLNILTRTLLLRRTKDQRDSTGQPLVSLPDRTSEVHRLKLSEDEQAVYDVLFAQHEPFSQQAKQVSSTVHILSLLLRLRQCCCHLSLLKKTLDSSELQGDGIVLSLEEQLNALSLSSSPSPSEFMSFFSQLITIFMLPSHMWSSWRVSPLLSSVIVSQWTSMLQIVAVHLQLMGLTYSVIDGTVNPKRRMDLVEEFNTNPKGPQVMLVSLCAGGVGLNLIGGNHLFLIDMHWNPALEDQACDRIYRVGQYKDVTIHRFVCENTVEEKISTLQTKKKELAQNVLSGTGNTLSKLSLADLKIIFGV
uniref:Transcription termination factor 2 n=1 Tax=Astatotilapia calliptera TaxID=8154 RepID=A0AAX7VKL4_ASTCA